jgi:hypothetical protein
MSQGIKISNTNGVVIADDTYKNFSIASIQTVNMANLTQAIFTDYKALNITDYGRPPLVFARMHRSNGFVHLKNVQNNRLGFICLDANKNFNLSLTFDLMLAYPISGTAVGTHGLAIYDSTGQKTFDSRIKMPRVGYICSGGTYVDSAKHEVVVSHGLNRSSPWFCLSSIMAIKKYTLSGSYFWATATHDNNSIVYVSGTSATSYSVGGTVFPAVFHSPILLNS